MNEEQYKLPSKEEIELRNKPWDELTDAQKIERQRDIIKDLQRSISFMQNRLNQLGQNFSNHQHSEKGIVIPLTIQGLSGSLGAEVAKLANSNCF